MFNRIYTFTVRKKRDISIATNRLLTSFALLLRVSNLGTMLDTITKFRSFINDIANSITEFVLSLDPFPFVVHLSFVI